MMCVGEPFCFYFAAGHAIRGNSSDPKMCKDNQNDGLDDYLLLENVGQKILQS